MRCMDFLTKSFNGLQINGEWGVELENIKFWPTKNKPPNICYDMCFIVNITLSRLCLLIGEDPVR